MASRSVDLRGEFNWLTGRVKQQNGKAWFAAIAPRNGQRAVVVALMGRHQVVAAARGNDKVGLEWTLYHVPDANTGELRGLMESEAQARVRVALVDKFGDPVKQTTVTLDQACHNDRENVPFRRGYSGNVDEGRAHADVFFVSPLLWRYSNVGHIFVVSPQPFETELTVTKEEGQRIAKVVLYVEKAGR
jgi:hypothetical protein